MRSWRLGLVFIALVLVGGAPSQACVGARALAMGGAFVGLADDASATYWNPAALADLKERQATWMHTSTNRDEINYLDYLAFVTPVGSNSAAGLSYIKYQMIPATITDGDTISWDETWCWLSYAMKVDEQTYAGANLRFIEDDLNATEDGVPVDISADTEAGLDIAIYRRASETLTIGILVQNVNEPQVDITEEGQTAPFAQWGRNFRPGAAIRLNGGFTLAAEVYDAADEGDARALRLGVEKRFEEQRFALRAGRYAAADISALTLGAGAWREAWALDVVYMGGDLDGTWLVSATAKF